MFQKWVCLLVFSEYAYMYNMNIYSRMWIFSYYVIFDSFSYVIEKTFQRFFYISGLFWSCLQHLTLSKVLVHIQIIVRNNSEPLDTFSSFCKSLDEWCRRQKKIHGKVYCLHQKKTLHFVAHRQTWSKDREKNKSIPGKLCNRCFNRK